MVEPLPVGVCLTAIFDSCHSGTLLDLEHYDCYKVNYNDTTGTGSRKSRSNGSTSAPHPFYSLSERPYPSRLEPTHAHDSKVHSVALPNDVQEAKKADPISVPSGMSI